MSQNTKATLVFFITLLSLCVGAVDFSCDKVDPVQPSTLNCKCGHPKSKGILLYKNNQHISDCYLKTGCLGCPGCSLSVNKSTYEYTFSVDFYDYSNCDMYTCRDLRVPGVNDTKRIEALDSTSISALNVSEPTTNHTSGFIGVTTECIYGASSEVTYLDIQWLIVMEGVEKSFNPRNTTIKPLNGSCQVCDGDKATQFIIGFYHKEEMGCQGKEAKVRIILRHKGISSEPLNITTRNVYCVSDQTSDGTSSRRRTISYILIFIIVFVLAQYSVLAFICKYRKRNTNRLGSTELILLLACVPALGIIVIAYLCTRRSGTNTGGTSIRGDSEINAENTDMPLTGLERQPDNLNKGDSEVNAENTDMPLTGSERQPDNLNNGYNKLRNGDYTKHNDSNNGYISNGTTTHST